MPPTRRKSSNPHSAQQTLAFGPRTSANKVTKPSLPASTKKLNKPVSSEPLVKALSEEVSTPEPAAAEDVPSAQDVKQEEEPEQPKELAIRAQPPAKTEAEERAAKISEAQIKRYWKAKEDERKAPRGTPSFFHFLRQQSKPTNPSPTHQSTNTTSPSTRKSSATSTSPPNTAPASACRG